MHVHHQPPDIRGLHLIALGLGVVALHALAGVAGFLTVVGG